MPIRTLTVLLADLVGSSSYVTTIPQDQAVDYLRDATLPIEQAVLAHEGKIIKFTGDGYLAVFESACQALRAAELIRHDFLRQRHTPAGVSLDGVRVVLNTADISIEEDDIMGDGVAAVSRLEKDVPTNQIYVTQAVREVADDAEFTFEPVGEVRLRGWHRPLMVYQLTSGESSFIDPGVFLLITDLHGLIRYGENLAPGELRQWLLAWGDLHREAVSGLKGRVRQFVADMALVTFTNADDAVHGILNLQILAAHHNQKHSDLPPIHFKAALAHGDLVLSPTGIVGKLVNHAFDLLNATPRATISIDAGTYQQLEAFTNRFRPISLTTPQGDPLPECYQFIDAEKSHE
jgi:class 3 adenylate cyclase